MNRYYSEGGASNPNFRYKVKVANTTDEMFNWCSTYPGRDYFDRWYVKWMSGNEAVFQFENEQPAIMFALKFADQ